MSLYYLYQYYLTKFPSSAFLANDRGIAVYKIKRDKEGDIQSELYDSIYGLVESNSTLMNIIKIRKTVDEAEIREDAIPSCKRNNAFVCVWGTYINQTLNYLGAVQANNPDRSIFVPTSSKAEEDTFAGNVVALASPSPQDRPLGNKWTEKPASEAPVIQHPESEVQDRLAALERTVATLVDEKKARELSSAERVRRRIGLIVGVSQYETLPALRYSSSDARSLSDLVKVLWPNTQIYLLTDKQASRQGISFALNQIKNEVKADDQVWVYLSGHTLSSGREAYFLPYDANPAQSAIDGVNLKEIKDVIDGLTASQKVIFVDTCYSGSIVGNLAKGIADEDELLQPAGNGTVVFAATSGEQLAFEDANLGHGVFTNAILEGLKGKAAGVAGIVTAESLSRYVNFNVGQYAVNGVRQIPAFYSNAIGMVVLAPSRTSMP